MHQVCIKRKKMRFENKAHTNTSELHVATANQNCTRTAARCPTLTKASLIMAIAIFNKITAAYSSHMKKNTGPKILFASTTDL